MHRLHIAFPTRMAMCNATYVADDTPRIVICAKSTSMAPNMHQRQLADAIRSRSCPLHILHLQVWRDDRRDCARAYTHNILGYEKHQSSYASTNEYLLTHMKYKVNIEQYGSANTIQPIIAAAVVGKLRMSAQPHRPHLGRTTTMRPNTCAVASREFRDHTSRYT